MYTQATIKGHQVLCVKCGTVVFNYARGMGGPAWVLHEADGPHSVSFAPVSDSDVSPG